MDLMNSCGGMGGGHPPKAHPSKSWKFNSFGEVKLFEINFSVNFIS